MLCSSCGTEHSDSALSCLTCGRPLGNSTVATGVATEEAAEESPSSHWEYKNLTIPLNMTSSRRDFVQRYDEIVRSQLRAVAPQGWHPVDPIDWGATYGSGRVKRAGSRPWYRLFGIGGQSYRWESVTIRVKRASPS